jgi:hypothetical protein
VLYLQSSRPIAIAPGTQGGYTYSYMPCLYVYYILETLVLLIAIAAAGLHYDDRILEIVTKL